MESIKAAHQKFWRSRTYAKTTDTGRSSTADVKRPHTSWLAVSRPLTSSTALSLDEERISTAVSSSSVCTSTYDACSDLTQSEEVLVGGPLRAIREKRRSAHHHTQIQNDANGIRELLDRYRASSMVPPSCLTDEELDRRKAALEARGGRPHTADVRIHVAHAGSISSVISRESASSCAVFSGDIAEEARQATKLARDSDPPSRTSHVSGPLATGKDLDSDYPPVARRPEQPVSAPIFQSPLAKLTNRRVVSRQGAPPDVQTGTSEDNPTEITENGGEILVLP